MGLLSASKKQQERAVETDVPWTPVDYGGWGGHECHGTNPGCRSHPIIFIHGNGRTADDWKKHANALLRAGKSGDDIWAITFGEPTPSHDRMATEIERFVSEVMDYTGMETVSIVAHSLGVTGARWWLETRNRYDSVETFVGIAGANHGLRLATVAAKVGVRDGVCKPVDFLRDDYRSIPNHPLKRLNSPTETPGDTDYYTIRGTRDVLFVNSFDSPKLKGGINIALNADHDELRLRTETIGLLRDVL